MLGNVCVDRKYARSMTQYSRSPEVSRLAAEAAEELQNNPFFEADLDSPLEAIEHYCRSHLAFQRLAYAQGIAAAALAAGYQDCVEVLLPLVEHLARDSEPEIRSIAVQQICGLGVALHKKDAERSLQDIESTLLVCAQQCALDDEEEVSQAAIVAFQQLTQLLPAARATAASKRAVDRLEVRGTDDGTLAAVRLLAHTVCCWTQVALQRHVPRYVNRWANHRDFSVREAVATCMSLIVQPMPLALCHQLLLPFFYQLCRDSNWRVRRACSMDLPRLAQALHDHSQKQQQQPQQQHQQQAKQQQGQFSISDSHHSGCIDPVVDGCCCDKTSTCLRVIRLSSELGSLSTGNLQAAAHGGLHARNRSSPAINMPLRSATTAEIMTKHPMHSSLSYSNAEGGLSGASPAPQSALTSPVSSSQPVQPSMLESSIAQEEEEQQQQQQQQQRSIPANQHASGVSEYEAEHSACLLERSAPLLHDCWCALRQCMELLSADSSHWVKVAAMSGLGPFILLLPGCQVGLLLLGRFTSMASSTVVIYEISVALSCAQHFGLLAVRLGPQRWPEMRDAWHALQLSRDPAVLCEVVKCFPSLIPALGPAIVVQELLPALAGLLQSHLSWIANQLVAVMAELMEALPPSSQDILLKVLDQLVSPSSERSKSWRLRRDLALQLGRMAAAAGPGAVTDSLWQAAITLCCDPVAAVRSAAASQVGPMLAALPADLLAQRDANALDSSCSSSSSSDPNSEHSSDGGSSCTDGGTPSPRDVLRCNSGEFGCDTSGSSKECSPCEQHCSGEDGATDVDHDSCTEGMCMRDDTGAQGSSQQEAAEVGTDEQHDSSSAGAATAAPEQTAPYSLRFQAYVNGGLGSYNSVQHSRCSSGRSSCDLELELPSALAPAPAPAVPVPASYSAHPALGRVISSSLGALGDGTASLLHDSGSNGESSSGDNSDSSSDSSSIGSDSDQEQEAEPSISITSLQQQQQQAGQLVQEHPGQKEQQQQQEQQQQHEHGQLPDAREQGSGIEEPVGASGLVDFLVSPQRQQQLQQLTQPSQPQPVPQRASAVAMHPAMMPIGHPAMMPVGSQQQQPQQQQQQRVRHTTPPQFETPAVLRAPLPAQAKSAAIKAKSAGDLLKVEAAAAERSKRRHSSTSMPARTLPAPAMGSSSTSSFVDRDYDPSLPDPSVAAPHQYVACLINFFGCSSHHQQRQLFVPLVMGMLAACHHQLSCAQAAQLLDRLEVLATDSVPGVRYAVASALQDLQVQAAAVQQEQQQPPTAAALQCGGPSGAPAAAQQQQAVSTTAAINASAEDIASSGALALSNSSGESPEDDSIDSYKKYVKQLAAMTPGAAQKQRQKPWEESAAADATAEDHSSTSTATGDAAAVCKLRQQQSSTETACAGNAQAGSGGNAQAGLEWLVKLSNCQQLERLMGVVALTTGA